MEGNREGGLVITAKRPVNPLTTSILLGLVDGDSLGVTKSLRSLKTTSGATNFVEVLKIPMQDRIPGLVENIGLEWVHKLITAGITLAMEALNLKSPMTDKQIFLLTDEIIDSAAEDALSLEDVLLFLQGLVRGEAGETYNKMDGALFMSLFEKHRQKRHRALKNHEYEQDVHFKALGSGPTGDVKINRDEDPKDLLNLMQSLYEKNDE